MTWLVIWLLIWHDLAFDLVGVEILEKIAGGLNVSVAGGSAAGAIQ